MSMLIALAMATAPAVQAGGAKPCDAQVMAQLTAPAGVGPADFELTCSVTLRPGQRIARRILLRGREASGVTIDCRGGTIGVEGSKTPAGALLIQSVQRDKSNELEWSRPSDITIRNCRLLGMLRTRGIDPGDRHEREARLSRRPDFTALAQRAAPTRIRLLNSEIHALGAIPIYLGTGTTAVTVSGTRIRGTAALAIYLDQESARNRIENSDIDITIKDGRRELIAVDGSAHNIIRGNRLVMRSPGGAIRLYRNCGERGVIRHQTPSFNVVTRNALVDLRQLRGLAIVENARSHRKASYCDLDKGYPFGSSADDRDGGQGNVIRDNRTRGA